ncbi:hypothetical protein ACX8Z9_06525 [Arthrobacter halodurans]|uniref:Asp23/Gls24 family envelope stress response protein n=1 Tax=Arthrobacter halodurans TaxID=516699 RepID=A0ABV4ULH5_9MICC
MTSDRPFEADIVDLETVADMLATALAGEPGLRRLEPTVRSVLKRVKIASMNSLHETLRHSSADPAVATRDGLILSMADGALNVHIDIATDMGHPALGVAGRIQAAAAGTVQRAGFPVGRIDVTILAIEDAPFDGGSASMP